MNTASKFDRPALTEARLSELAWCLALLWEEGLYQDVIPKIEKRAEQIKQGKE